MLGLNQPDFSFDPAQHVVFETPLPAPVTALLSKDKAQINYQLKKDGVDSQLYSVQLDKNSMVVFSEMVYPGWKAFVDGQPSEIFTADNALRSLFLTSGNHEVEFKYQPSWFYPLIALLGIWGISAIFYGVWLYASREPKIIEHKS
jgi:uncharacterized membrane protein YfhO